MITRRFFFAVLLVIIAPAFWNSVAAAERLTVVSPVANIRSGPGLEYEILWKVERFHPLEILKRSGKWCFFRDFEGDEGWIHSSLLAAVPAVITRADKCNVRSGPGTGHPVLFTVNRGIPFRVLDTRGAWLHVQHADGDKGWIHRSLVW